jgi:GAF domain-containing protein
MNNTFGKEIVPPNEQERLQALRQYQILDSDPEPGFEKIAKLAAKIFNMPIALISFVDEEQVFFMANVGMPGVRSTDRGVSFCSLAILDEDPTVIERPLEDPCFRSNPLVKGNFGLRFYAGAPIRTPDGHNIGTLCIVDKKQRYLTEAQKALLADLAAIVMDQLEGRLALLQLKG